MRVRTGIVIAGIALGATGVAVGCSDGPPGKAADADSGGHVVESGSDVRSMDVVSVDVVPMEAGPMMDGSVGSDSTTPDAGADTGGMDSMGGMDTGTSGVLAEQCAAACKAQASLSCFTDTTSCQTACVKTERATENPSVSCAGQYNALAACEATLTHWTCSTTSNDPIPATGECMSTVCPWACCVGSDISDPDIWTECMPTCP